MRSLITRVRRRIVYATIAAVLAGFLSVLTVWLGLPTRFRPVNDPRPISEIWWYFPAFGAIGFVLVLLMPKSFDEAFDL